jgi:hypothetical protein
VLPGDAPPSAPIKLRKPRKAVPLGASGEQQSRLQELGDALALLVHAIACGDALADGLAHRVHELWLGQLADVLEWRPTELRAAGRTVLAADARSGRFIFSAYGAGLRALAMRRASTPGDVLSLGRQLALLDAGALESLAFARWLWRGGAFGFDVAQAAAAAELGEALISTERPETELWAERSRDAVERWNELAWKSAQALDAAVLSERFLVPLERMRERTQQGEHALRVDEAAALREAADDSGAWAEAEIGLLLEHPALRGALPVTHLTFRLIELVEGGHPLDVRLLELCAALGRGQDARPMAETLDSGLLGAAVARQLIGRGGSDGRWLELADRAEPELLAGLLAHLCERAEAEPKATRILTALLMHWSAPVLFARIDLGRVKALLGAALLAAAVEAQTEIDELLSVLERVPVETALLALIASPALLSPAQPLLERLIAEQPLSSGPLLCQLVQASPAGARSVGAALLARRGDGLPPGVLRAALLALVRAGSGAPFVLPLWEARAASSAVRLAALSALEADTSLLTQALRARVGGILEPAEIREALEELRWRRPP